VYNAEERGGVGLMIARGWRWVVAWIVDRGFQYCVYLAFRP